MLSLTLVLTKNVCVIGQEIFILFLTVNFSVVEKPAETLRPASAIASRSVRSGGHEFESPVPQELGALTKSGKALWVRSFYSDDPDMII